MDTLRLEDSFAPYYAGKDDAATDFQSDAPARVAAPKSEIIVSPRGLRFSEDEFARLRAVRRRLASVVERQTAAKH